MSQTASVQQQGASLVFSGALVRGAIAALWAQLARVDGVDRFDLTAVERVDSVGLALLVELAERFKGVDVAGDPVGLSELRRAYRLTPAFSFL